MAALFLLYPFILPFCCAVRPIPWGDSVKRRDKTVTIKKGAAATESYITVKKEGFAEITEKKSRFLAAVYPVKRASEAEELIKSAKKKHFDARHNVWAYSLLDGTCRYTDDGEPSGTAGVPILEIMKKQKITDCLIIVTRYFGGILLGTGGLCRAYSAAAAAGLEAAGKVTLVTGTTLTVSCDYTDFTPLCRILEDFGAAVEDQEFGARVSVSFTVRNDRKESLSARLTDAFCGKLSPKPLAQKFIPDE